MNTAQHRTTTPEKHFGSFDNGSGLTAQLAKINDRDGIEIRTRFGRTLWIPISDVVDLAHGLDKIVTYFVSLEVAKKGAAQR